MYDICRKENEFSEHDFSLTKTDDRIQTHINVLQIYTQRRLPIMKRLIKNKGFTLIELVIVIAILGILAGIAIPRFMDATATARGARILADMRTLDSVATMYYAKAGTYPTLIITKNSSQGADKLTKNDSENKCYILIASVPAPVTGKVIFPCKPNTTVTLPDDAMYIMYSAGGGFLNPDLGPGRTGLVAQTAQGNILEVPASDLAEGGKGW
jgi:prepilin-type N-terminal cleavage/methylation domain-containing protein